MAGAPGSLASSRLRRLARAPAAAPALAAAEDAERCELCGAPIAAEHRHLLDLDTREVACACRACALLFDRPGIDAGRFRTIGDRRLRIADLELSDLMWEELRLPVDMAFFFHGSREGRVRAFYPSPMGPTESLLGLEAWADVEAANPVLATLVPDTEALLVDRARGARRHWIVPIDECYRLVGLFRTPWGGVRRGGRGGGGARGVVPGPHPARPPGGPRGGA